MKNKVNLMGYLGNDPEIKNLENGKKVVNFRLATSETYTNAKGEKTTSTQWHNLRAWDKTATHIEKYLKKGSGVDIEGKLMYESWEDKEGQKHYSCFVLVDEIIFMPKSGTNE